MFLRSQNSAIDLSVSGCVGSAVGAGVGAAGAGAQAGLSARASTHLKLGCSKCRHSTTGCTQCRGKAGVASQNASSEPATIVPPSLFATSKHQGDKWWRCNDSEVYGIDADDLLKVNENGSKKGGKGKGASIAHTATVTPDDADYLSNLLSWSVGVVEQFGIDCVLMRNVFCPGIICLARSG